MVVSAKTTACFKRKLHKLHLKADDSTDKMDQGATQKAGVGWGLDELSSVLV